MATSSPLSEKAPEEINNPGQELADREFNPDRQTTPAGNPTDPRGNDVASGDASDPRGKLRDKELATTGTEHENQVGSGYHRGQPPRKLTVRGLLTKKNGLYGGGMIGLIIAIVVSMFAAGPLQLVHLSQVLQHPFSKSESDSSNRLGKMFRYAKSGNFGETRVGYLGSKVFGSAIDDLNKAGVDIKTNAVGRPVETTFDTEKLKANFPELEGMSQEEVKSFLAEKMNLSADAFKTRGVTTGGKVTTEYFIDQSNYDLKALRFQAKGTAALLDDGRIATALKGRVLTKFFGLPSLFHPFQRLKEDKINEIINAREKAAAQQQEEQDRQTATEPQQEADGAKAAADIKNQTKGAKLLFTAATAASAACLVRGLSGEIIKVNHDLVVLPSEAKAADAIAIGAQVQAGKDLTQAQAATFGKDLEDANGRSVWQGRSLQALARNGRSDASLTDLPPDYRQAYSPKTTVATINGTANKILDYVPGGASLFCSAPVQITIGLAALFGTVVAEVGSLGTLTPAVAGAWAADEASTQIITMTALHFMDNFILDKTTYKLAADAFSGPVGGDLLAYGARAAANTAAIASGGISLANNTTTIVSSQDQQQYQNMSIAKKLLDPYDSRSTVASLIDNVSTSPLQNLSKMGSIFTSFGSLFGHSFSAILPKAAAANTPYNWGFPQYGIPDSLLNDPNLDDPYANADAVAKLLDGSNGPTFKSRALSCFGVKITSVTDDAGKPIWDVLPQNEVNPASSDYTSPSANCNDTSEAWHRIMMFVFDTTTMKAAACYENDEQPCTDLGAESSGNLQIDTSATGGNTGGALPSGSAKDLAKQLITYINNGKLKCNSSLYDIACSDITNTANGVNIPSGEGCTVASLDPKLLGMMLELLQMNHTFTLSAICSDHHDDGSGGHSTGQAADFNIIDGVPFGEGEDEDGTIAWTTEGALGQQKIQEDQKFLQDVASFMPKSTGIGQTQCHDEFSFLQGFNTFPDGCHHQHIQVSS